MGKTERRNRVALDQAYNYYRSTIVNDAAAELHRLVNSLKTISYALHNAPFDSFKLTRRLWLRIEQALFDKLITSFPAYLIVQDAYGKVLTAEDDLSEDCVIELHPEGLRRADDVFQMPFGDLSVYTQMQLARVWKSSGSKLRREDFQQINCEATGLCPMKPFAPGHELLHEEAQSGKLIAYEQWWNLYWQAYCTSDHREKNLLMQKMYSLESVWGNLYY